MPIISIQATDTLFFRDGRPFSMGEETFAQGLFPPPPSVIYGALRSSFISDQIELGHNQVDAIKESESLRINGIYLKTINLGYAGGSIWHPMPMDLIVPKKDGQAENAVPLKFGEKPTYSSASLLKVLQAEGVDKTEDGAFLLNKREFAGYLNGEKDEFVISKLSDFLSKEQKIGIGRDYNSHVADEGKLFRVIMNRPATTDNGNLTKLQFLINYSDLALETEGWLNVGGERRVASFKAEDEYDVPLPEITQPLCKIYLSTPAIFRDGWKPEKLLKDNGLTLIAAAMGKSQPMGGWDLDKWEPKPMVQAVSAGSVYFVQAENIDAVKAFAEKVHGKSISDNFNGIDYQKQGFGIAYIGNVDINQ